jgi:ABC-type phosphate transport system substrate-binding protein
MKLLRWKLGSVLAGTALVLLLGGINAGGAAAACPTNPLEIAGSTLQRVAQKEVWIPAFTTSTCIGLTINYTGNGNEALNKWGAAGGIVGTATHLVLSDDPPTRTQIANMRSATTGAGVVTIPVAQAPIAVVIHPPIGCVFKKITNRNLEKAFSGAATSWAAIGGTGPSCAGSIIRVVPTESSGETYQFKRYLNQVSGEEEVTCDIPHRTWLQLAEPAQNTAWPVSGACSAVPLHRSAAGGGVAEYVALNEGTIGFAGLPDALAKAATTAEVQDNGNSGTPLYGSPKGEEEPGEPNCEANNSLYNKPLKPNGLEPVTEWSEGGKPERIWTEVFGANPNIKGVTGVSGSYPLCTLTYVVAWHGYGAAGYAAPTNVAETVKEYAKYLTSTGQSALTSTLRGYAPLGTNPLAAATAGVLNITP